MADRTRGNQGNAVAVEGTGGFLPPGNRFGVPALPLESVNCYLCGASEGRILVDDPPFQVKECQNCGLGYTTPRVQADRIHEIYESDKYFASDSAETFGYNDYDRDVEAYIRTFRRKSAWILKHAKQPPARVLEVGAAGGAFLKVMQDQGYEVHGTEVSPHMVQAARRRFGFSHLHEGRLLDVDLKDNSFDIVALFDVIEHLPDPIAELKRCFSLLTGNGVLVLQTQDLGSRTRKLLGARWQHFKQLEHIYHFNHETLRSLLSRAGFELRATTRRNAGKYVRVAEFADRAERVCGVPRFLTSPFRWFGSRYCYVNPLDEILAVATRKP
jgi:2-polyprenyl-3-methyl-5-hydroxy-6-metoxy-1,4-benzoquinol methylase